jgi:fibronectin type 3 domain-containing protein
LGLTVSSSTQTAAVQIALIWHDNSNNEDNFAIERKTGTSGTYSQIATTAMNVTSYVDTTVNRGVTYCYQVRAVNSAGASAYTNEACKTVP